MREGARRWFPSWEFLLGTKMGNRPPTQLYYTCIAILMKAFDEWIRLSCDRIQHIDVSVRYDYNGFCAINMTVQTSPQSRATAKVKAKQRTCRLPRLWGDLRDDENTDIETFSGSLTRYFSGETFVGHPRHAGVLCDKLRFTVVLVLRETVSVWKIVVQLWSCLLVNQWNDSIDNNRVKNIHCCNHSQYLEVFLNFVCSIVE